MSTRPDGTPEAPPSAGRKAAAIAVHLFTASGAALGLMALLAAVRGDYPQMFAWLGAALLVDGVDGYFARLVRTGETLPGLSGDTLDLVVDYVTYVLVPAYALAASGLLPEGFAEAGAAILCVTAALYFARADMKTDDWRFRGFPAVWNVVVFYLFLLQPPPALSLAIVIALSALHFAPIAFVHPFRVLRLRALTLALLVAWCALGTIAISQSLAPNFFVMSGLVAIGLYFTVVGLLRPERS